MPKEDTSKGKDISQFTISERDSRLLSRTRIHSKKRKTWKGRRKPTVDQERADLEKNLTLAIDTENTALQNRLREK